MAKLFDHKLAIYSNQKVDKQGFNILPNTKILNGRWK